ncbi:MAG: DUF4920 domain-containing protein [Labilithrix sp.]
MLRAFASLALASSLALACDGGPKPEPKSEPSTPAPTVQQAPPEASLRLGAPIDTKAEKVALSDVAKAPDSYVNKTFTTTGTVTAVCQHMGCWMEIKDDSSEAHIKMAGHKFFVPKTASGKKARIQAKLVPSENKGSCEGEGSAEGHHMAAAESKEGKKGCREEAEQQLGRPLAKLELVADGVELL